MKMKTKEFNEIRDYIKEVILENSKTETELQKNKSRCKSILKLSLKNKAIPIEEYEFLTEFLEETYKTQIFNIALSNFIGNYTLESVDHFLTCKGERYIPDNARYFMNSNELKTFLEKFKSHGGTEDMIHVSIINMDDGEFLSYEVVSQEIWDNPKLRSRACYLYQKKIE